MLLVTVGLPGSGKSTWAHENVRHIVSPDRIRLEEFGVVFDADVEEAVWRRAREATRALLLEGKLVCFDATSVSRRRRRSLVVLAREAGAPTVAVWLRVSDEVAWLRNVGRERPVPLGSFLDLARAFEPPSMEEGFAAVLEVGGEGERAPV